MKAMTNYGPNFIHLITAIFIGMWIIDVEVQIELWRLHVLSHSSVIVAEYMDCHNC